MECVAEAMINQNGLSLISNSEFFALKRRFFFVSRIPIKALKQTKKGVDLGPCVTFNKLWKAERSSN